MVVERTAYRQVAVRGANVAYQVAGTGPAIMLIKNNRRPRDFAAVEWLADRFTVLQVHPVGFGASDRPTAYSFGEIASQVLAVADRECIDRFVVWGFSQCAAMAAMVARSTERAVALIAGGFQLLDAPTDGTMRRLEREPRLPRPALEFWRAYREVDWYRELRRLPQPKLAYMGAKDPARPRMRRFEPALRHCGCDCLEFPGLDHTSAGLAEASGATVEGVTAWLHEKVGTRW